MFALSIGLCFLAFLSSLILGRKSLVAGICAVMFWGYTYGIVRANVISPASHFIFDLSLIGLYAVRLFERTPLEVTARQRGLGTWVGVITAWTLFVAMLPFQSPMITLVGLRGNLFFVPMLLLVSRLREAQLRPVIIFLAGLNVLAAGFAIAEYFKGVPAFYPESLVTLIIYRSRDVAGGNYRIPAIFANAHSYAGTMVATLPLLMGAVGIKEIGWRGRILIVLGISSSIMGVLFSNTRTNFLLMMIMIFGFLLMTRMKTNIKVGVLFVIGIFGVIAMGNERFQRFRTIDSTGAFTDRIAGSVNRSLLEVFLEYPMGNGLGGGGTSVPHFLVGELRRPVSVENEYARMALELGIPGMLLWIAFLTWVLVTGMQVNPRDSWKHIRRLVLVYLLFSFLSAAIGTGMLTSIPGAALTFFCAGWVVTKPHPDDLPPPTKRRAEIV